MASRSDEELAGFVRDGQPAVGMPGFALADAEMKDLVLFLRTLRGDPPPEPVRGQALLDDGRALEGLVLNQNGQEMQLLPGASTC